MQIHLSPEQPPLLLRDRASTEPAQSDDLIYDAVFELCGYKFYVVVLPVEEQPEALRRALQMYDKTEEHVQEAIKGKRKTSQISEALEAKLSSADRKVYAVIVRHAVVAWQPLNDNGEAVFFTLEEQEKLSAPARRQVSQLIVEAFR